MIKSHYQSGLASYWWLPLINGLICIGLGVWTICSPVTALPAMAWAFAVCILAIGITDGFWAIFSTSTNPHWGWDICMSIIDIIAGVWMLSMNPSEMTLTFLYIIGIWLIFVAFSDLGRIFSTSSNNPFAVVLGVLLLIATLIFTFWMIFNPIGLGVTAWLWIGISLCCYGAFKTIFAFRIRSLRN